MAEFTSNEVTTLFRRVWRLLSKGLTGQAYLIISQRVIFLKVPFGLLGLDKTYKSLSISALCLDNVVYARGYICIEDTIYPSYTKTSGYDGNYFLKYNVL